MYRVYPLEQRPGNLIPFSIYLNPLTQTRLLGSSSTSGLLPSFTPCRGLLLLYPLRSAAFISSRCFANPLRARLTFFPFQVAVRKEANSFLLPLLSAGYVSSFFLLAILHSRWQRAITTETKGKRKEGVRR